LLFFSSRRRHTRFSRDWSSDVCSSDLERLVGPGDQEHVAVEPKGGLVMNERDRRVGGQPKARVAALVADVVAAAGGRLRLGAPEIGRASCRGRVESTVVVL